MVGLGIETPLTKRQSKIYAIFIYKASLLGIFLEVGTYIKTQNVCLSN